MGNIVLLFTDLGDKNPYLSIKNGKIPVAVHGTRDQGWRGAKYSS